MTDAAGVFERRGGVGLATSVVSMLALMLLIHRALPPEVLGETSGNAKWLFPGFLGLGALDRVFLLGVAGGCGWAVGKRRPEALTQLQLAALGLGLLLTQYRLGEAPRKVDPRLVLGIFSGVVALQSCYLCLLAHAVLWLRRRFSESQES